MTIQVPNAGELEKLRIERGFPANWAGANVATFGAYVVITVPADDDHAEQRYAVPARALLDQSCVAVRTELQVVRRLERRVAALEEAGVLGSFVVRLVVQLLRDEVAE